MQYIVMIDLEATVNNGNDWRNNQIIQLAAHLVDVQQEEIVDTFNTYCRPVGDQLHLSDRCIELTGITQSMMNRAPYFGDALNNFEDWLVAHGLIHRDGSSRLDWVIAADNVKDFNYLLYNQCVNISEIRYPDYALQVLTIGPLFNPFYWYMPANSHWGSIAKWLEYFGMEFEGNPHDAQDDAYNAARIILQMIEDGVDLYPTYTIFPDSPKRPDVRGFSRTCYTELLV